MTMPIPDDGQAADREPTTEPANDGVAWVYVPTCPSRAAESAEFELRQLPDGTGALPVFTDPDLLAERFGEFQPREKVAVLDLLVQVSAAKVSVVVNPVLDDEAPRWSESDLDEWRQENP
jgi:hypothetical protein